MGDIIVGKVNKGVSANVDNSTQRVTTKPVETATVHTITMKSPDNVDRLEKLKLLTKPENNKTEPQPVVDYKAQYESAKTRFEEAHAELSQVGQEFLSAKESHQKAVIAVDKEFERFASVDEKLSPLYSKIKTQGGEEGLKVLRNALKNKNATQKLAPELYLKGIATSEEYEKYIKAVKEGDEAYLYTLKKNHPDKFKKMSICHQENALADIKAKEVEQFETSLDAQAKAEIEKLAAELPPVEGLTYGLDKYFELKEKKDSIAASNAEELQPQLQSAIVKAVNAERELFEAKIALYQNYAQNASITEEEAKKLDKAALSAKTKEMYENRKRAFELCRQDSFSADDLEKSVDASLFKFKQAGFSTFSEEAEFYGKLNKAAAEINEATKKDKPSYLGIEAILKKNGIDRIPMNKEQFRLLLMNSVMETDAKTANDYRNQKILVPTLDYLSKFPADKESVDLQEAMKSLTSIPENQMTRDEKLAVMTGLDNLLAQEKKTFKTSEISLFKDVLAKYGTLDNVNTNIVRMIQSDMLSELKSGAEKINLENYKKYGDSKLVAALATEVNETRTELSELKKAFKKYDYSGNKTPDEIIENAIKSNIPLNNVVGDYIISSTANLTKNYPNIERRAINCRKEIERNMQDYASAYSQKDPLTLINNQMRQHRQTTMDCAQSAIERESKELEKLEKETSAMTADATVAQKLLNAQIEKHKDLFNKEDLSASEHYLKQQLIASADMIGLSMAVDKNANKKDIKLYEGYAESLKTMNPKSERLNQKDIAALEKINEAKVKEIEKIIDYHTKGLEWLADVTKRASGEYLDKSMGGLALGWRALGLNKELLGMTSTQLRQELEIIKDNKHIAALNDKKASDVDLQRKYAIATDGKDLLVNRRLGLSADTNKKMGMMYFDKLDRSAGEFANSQQTWSEGIKEGATVVAAVATGEGAIPVIASAVATRVTLATADNVLHGKKWSENLGNEAASGAITGGSIAIIKPAHVLSNALTKGTVSTLAGKYAQNGIVKAGADLCIHSMATGTAFSSMTGVSILGNKAMGNYEGSLSDAASEIGTSFKHGVFASGAGHVFGKLASTTSKLGSSVNAYAPIYEMAANKAGFIGTLTATSDNPIETLKSVAIFELAGIRSTYKGFSNALQNAKTATEFQKKVDSKDFKEAVDHLSRVTALKANADPEHVKTLIDEAFFGKNGISETIKQTAANHGVNAAGRTLAEMFEAVHVQTLEYFSKTRFAAPNANNTAIRPTPVSSPLQSALQQNTITPANTIDVPVKWGHTTNNGQLVQPPNEGFGRLSRRGDSPDQFVTTPIKPTANKPVPFMTIAAGGRDNKNMTTNGERNDAPPISTSNGDISGGKSQNDVVAINTNSFENWIQNNKIGNSDLAKIISNQENLMGKGSTHNVYRIPGNDSFIIRASRNKMKAPLDENAKFEAVDNPFPNENFGQQIGNIGYLQVCRLQKGTPFSTDTYETNMQQLKALADMPQSTYENFVRQVQLLHSKGYGIDPSKSENILIDTENNSISIVDIAPVTETSTESVLYSLLHRWVDWNDGNSQQEAAIKEQSGKVMQKLIDAVISNNLEQPSGSLKTVIAELKDRGGDQAHIDALDAWAAGKTSSTRKTDNANQPAVVARKDTEPKNDITPKSAEPKNHADAPMISTEEVDSFAKAVEALKGNNLEGLEFVKNLSDAQRRELVGNLDRFRLKDFLWFATDNKPAVLMDTEVAKIVEQSLDTSKYDIVYDNNDAYILNKELVKNVIAENRELYTLKMGMPPDASVESIYKGVADKRGVLTHNAGYFHSGVTDIVGLTLGFPKRSCLIYPLAVNLRNEKKYVITTKDGESIPRSRITDLEGYKKALRNQFFNSEEVYDDYSDSLRAEVLDAIDSLKEEDGQHSNYLLTQNGDHIGYDFGHYGGDTEALGAIRQGFRKMSSQLQEIVEKNRPAAINTDKSSSDLTQSAELNPEAAKIEELRKSCEGEIEIKTIEFDSEGQQKFEIYTGSQSGSNPGYWGRNVETNELYYFKEGTNARNTEEALACDFYRAAGVLAPELSTINGGEMVASKFIPQTKDLHDGKSACYDTFAVSAWLANWDAVQNNNSFISGNQIAHVDNGGALRYRAQGEPKYHRFGAIVEEFETFLQGDNEYYYNGITKENIIDSCKKVLSISNEQIKEIVSQRPVVDPDALVKTLIARRNYIEFYKGCLESNIEMTDCQKEAIKGLSVEDLQSKTILPNALKLFKILNENNINFAKKGEHPSKNTNAIIKLIEMDFDPSTILTQETSIDAQNIGAIYFLGSKNAKALTPVQKADAKKKFFDLLSQVSLEDQTFMDLADSLNVKLNPLSKTETKQLIDCLGEISSTLAKIDTDNIEITQKISNTDLTNKLLEFTKDLSIEERTQVLNYFGLEINQNKNLEGHPVNIHDEKALSQCSSPVREAILKCSGAMGSYLSAEGNPVSVQLKKRSLFSSTSKAKQLEKELNELFSLMPELRTMIGQETGTDYTSDLLMLRTIQNLSHEKDNDYALCAALFSNMKNMDVALAFIEKLNLADFHKQKLASIMRSYFSMTNTENRSQAGYLADTLSNADVVADLGTAVLKSFEKDMQRYKDNKEWCDDMSSTMRTDAYNFEAGAVFMPVTTMPDAANLKKGIANGVGNISEIDGVIHIEIDKNTNFEAMGFPKGTTYNNFKFMLHTFRNKNNAQAVCLMSQLDNPNLLSVTYNNSRLKGAGYYGSNDCFAFMLEGRPHFFHVNNTDSGNKKTINNMLGAQSLSYNDETNRAFREHRQEMANQFKRAFDLNDEGYVNFIEILKRNPDRSALNTALKKLYLGNNSENPYSADSIRFLTRTNQEIESYEITPDNKVIALRIQDKYRGDRQAPIIKLFQDHLDANGRPQDIQTAFEEICKKYQEENPDSRDDGFVYIDPDNLAGCIDQITELIISYPSSDWNNEGVISPTKITGMMLPADASKNPELYNFMINLAKKKNVPVFHFKTPENRNAVEVKR